MEDIQYKVNIYSIVQETEDAIVESKELHEKVIVIDGNLCTYTEDMDRDGLHDNAWYNQIILTKKTTIILTAMK